MSSLVMFAVTTMAAFLVAATAAAPASENTTAAVTPTHRAGYTYYSIVKMFYKQHRSPASWDSARDICRQEGAELAYPDTPQQRVVFRVLQRGLNSVGQPTDMWLGIYAIPYNRSSLRTVHNSAIDIDVLNNGNPTGIYLAANESRFLTDFTAKLPFVCEISEDAACDASVPGYALGPDYKSCYKLHVTETNWTEALATCDAEGAQLAIINSRQEAEYLDAMVAAGYNPPREKDSVFSIGFQELAVDGLYFTVDGHPLASSGYEVWYTPPIEHAIRRCGVLFNGKLFNNQCRGRYPFVCEKKVAAPVAALPDCQRGTIISDVM